MSCQKTTIHYNRRRFECAAFLLTSLLIAVASAQSTQPSADAWNARVEQICTALPGNAVDQLSQLIPDETNIEPFDNSQTETRFRLAEHVSHMTVLWQHAYLGTPTSLVSDLSTDLSENPALPASLRRRLIPKDASAMPKADNIARQWVARVLAPEPGSNVSVVLFWERPASDNTIREPIFVLIKGRMQDGQPVISQIRYGEMNQALN